nr:protein YgfX [Halomonas socia]
MPKPPVTISTGPSRLALAVQTGLALVVVGLLAWVAAPWLAATALLCLAAVIAQWWRGQRSWSLRFASGEGGWQVAGNENGWRPVTLALVYIGPWLIGLRLDGRPVWLWPDSATPEARRELRRCLLAEQASGSARRWGDR